MFRGLVLVVGCLLLQQEVNAVAQVAQTEDYPLIVNRTTTWLIYNPEYPEMSSPLGLFDTYTAWRSYDISYMVLKCTIDLPTSDDGLCSHASLKVTQDLARIPDVYCGKLNRFTITSTGRTLTVAVDIKPGYTGVYFCSIKSDEED